MSKYRILDRKDDNILTHLLRSRGIDKEAEEEFLAPNYEKTHDPFLLNDMDKAVDRVLLAVKNGEHIAIFSDYDCDGIPGAVVLHDFFKEIGHENFSNHIPHRHYDGFGLSIEAVKKMAESGAGLIITIDCGTSDLEAAQSAASLGIDLIITDHHEPKEELPEAVAIVNPRIGDTYPFPHICGAAVAFKLAKAVIQKGNFSIKDGAEKWWLDMVGLATIGDMVPLLGENRIFAHYGLLVLRKSRRPGLHHLLKKAKANQAYLTEDDIGFTIAPRINAASRMDTPEDAFLLLSAKEEVAAGERATHLEKLNNERKGIVAAMTKELKHRLEELTEVPDVIVLGNPSWRPALVGLCANSISSEYGRPVFLWGRDGNGVIKGSCRSGGNVSVVNLMNGTSESFLEHGGHHASGGFAVKEDAIFHLTEALNSSFKSLGEKAMIDEEITIDADLDLSDINYSLLKTLKQLSPFGMANPKPIFAFRGVMPAKVDVFGKAKEHLKLTFSTYNGEIEAIAFFSDENSFQAKPKENESFNLLAHVEESYFMGRRQTRLRIVDILSTDAI